MDNVFLEKDGSWLADCHNNVEDTSIRVKDKEREDIQKHIDEFLKKGNKITKCDNYGRPCVDIDYRVLSTNMDKR